MEFTSADPEVNVGDIEVESEQTAQVHAVCNTLTGTYDITQVSPPTQPRYETNIQTIECDDA